MIRSDSPPAYTSALSKKLTPRSHAALKQSHARPVSSWLPKVTHDPNASTLTCSPERPSRRYSISVMRSTVSVVQETTRRSAGVLRGPLLEEGVHRLGHVAVERREDLRAVLEVDARLE